MSSWLMALSMRLYRAMASFTWRRSASITDGMSGYCSFTATSRPSGSVARCTCPRLAAARASWLKLLNFFSQSGPSSPAMRRRTKAQPMAGALACNSASCAAYSGGSASGTVERNCATFIIGPLRLPSRAFRSSAWRAWSVLMPNTLSPAMRAAMPPTAPEVRAMRRTSPNRLPRSDIKVDGGCCIGTRGLPLPSREGVGGRGCSSKFTNGDQHAFKVAEYIAVGDSRDANVALRHPGISHRIGWRIYMRNAVYFDDQADSRTIEIGDVRPKRNLTPELQAADLMLAKSLPGLSFRACGRSAHCAGVGEQRASNGPLLPTPSREGRGRFFALHFPALVVTLPPPARR